MKVFRELATHADQYIADLSVSGEPVPGVIDDYSKHDPHDWQKIVLHYLLNHNDRYRSNLHSEVLKEISAIETDAQFSELLEIQNEVSGVYIISEENKRQDLLRLKEALKRAVESGLT